MHSATESFRRHLDTVWGLVDASQFGPIKNRPWVNAGTVPAAERKCGYCASHVEGNTGYSVQTPQGNWWYIRLCPNCSAPTFFTQYGDYSPGSLPGGHVDHLPTDVASLFGEARSAVAAGAPTAAVLACRKILMHIAVEKKAEKNKSFVYYVEYLADKGYVSPDGKSWVDYISGKEQ